MKPTTKLLFGSLLVVAAALVLAGCQPAAPAFECTDAIGCVDIAPGAPIHIAYGLTTSGAPAPLGEDSKGAIEIAIDDRGGKLLDHDLQLTGEDTLRNAEGGRGAGRTAAARRTMPCPRAASRRNSP